MQKYNGKYVTIMLCSRCNNNCKHCYISYSGRFFDEELSKIIPNLNEKYTILLNGTEPIMYPEYYKYFKMVNEHRIITNGITILENPNILSQLLENEINEVWLSYHFEIQNEISKISETQLNNVIRILKKNNFIVKLMCSLSKHNYQNVSKFCEKALEVGADKIKFTNFISQGSAKDNFDNSEFLNQAQINFVLDEIEKMRLIIPKKDLNIQRCGTFGPNIHKNNFYCLAGQDMIILTPDRKLYNCVFNISNNSCIGYLDDDYNLIINQEASSINQSYCKVLKKYNGIGGKK